MQAQLDLQGQTLIISRNVLTKSTWRTYFSTKIL